MCYNGLAQFQEEKQMSNSVRVNEAGRKAVLRALPDFIRCPICSMVKPKGAFGVRIMDKDRQGFFTDIRQQPYCGPCRSYPRKAGVQS